MKERIIRDFIANYDFTNENWSVNDIKKGLQKLLGEIPAVMVNYEKDIMVNEISGKTKEIKKIDTVTLVFTNDNDETKRIDFKLDI